MRRSGALPLSLNVERPVPVIANLGAAGGLRVGCNHGPEREQDRTQRPSDLQEALAFGSLTVLSGLIGSARAEGCVETWALRSAVAYEDDAQISGAT